MDIGESAGFSFCLSEYTLHLFLFCFCQKLILPRKLHVQCPWASCGALKVGTSEKLNHRKGRRLLLALHSENYRPTLIGFVTKRHSVLPKNLLKEVPSDNMVIFQGCWNEGPQTGWLEPKVIYFRSVLWEVRGPDARALSFWRAPDCHYTFCQPASVCLSL